MKRWWIAFLLVSCGGGTSGTSPTGGGIAKVFQGSVVDEVARPVSGARISLTSGMGEGTTGARGEFSFVAELEAGDVAVEIQQERRIEVVPLPPLTAQEAAVRLDIQLGSNAAQLNDFELVLDGIGGGACEGAFGSLEVFDLAGGNQPLLIVNQSRPLPSGTECEAHFRVFSQGAPAPGVAWELIANLALTGFEEEGSPSGVTAVDEGSTDASGNGLAQFRLRSGEEMGFLLLEIPAHRPRSERVGIVINPLWRN